MQNATESRWRLNGVRVVRANELDINTPQTPGMNRAAAITYARAGAEKLWAGTVVVQPKAKTGAHHHGPVESFIYVVPPYVPHQEINADDDRRFLACWCAAARSRWWSISTYRMSNRIRNRCSGLTTSIRHK